MALMGTLIIWASICHAAESLCVCVYGKKRWHIERVVNFHDQEVLAVSIFSQNITVLKIVK